MSIDLAPFGFTPTESLAYEALLALGPASGYAVAKEIGVARANAYQALNGLVAKQAAVLIDENPLRFRSVRPDALLARIAGGEARKLAALEDQIRESRSIGSHAVVAITGERALLEVITRWAGRSRAAVWCVAPQRLLDALQPVWRKREADGSDTHLAPLPAGRRELIGVPDPAVFFWCEDAAVLASGAEQLNGYWFSDPLTMSTIRLAIDSLNQPVG